MAFDKVLDLLWDRLPIPAQVIQLIFNRLWNLHIEIMKRRKLDLTEKISSGKLIVSRQPH